MNRERFQGKTAIVTGGARGIGRCIAAALFREGARVAILSRPSAQLRTAIEVIGQHGMLVECDVSDPKAVRRAFEQVIAGFGRLDFLINNAAACLLHRVETAKDEDVLREVSTNFLGPLWCTRAAIPHFRAAGAGHVVNISSESVKAPVPFLSIYAATKSALENLSLGLVGELAGARIKVSVVRSGAVKGSNIAASWDPEQRAAFFDELVKSGRMAARYAQMDPEAVAERVIEILALPPSASVHLMDLQAF